MGLKFFRRAFLCVMLLSGLFSQFSASAAPSAQKTYDVSISERNTTVKGVADALTRQTGILFSYDADMTGMSLGDVLVNRKNASLNAILDEIFVNNGVAYFVVGETVVLSRSKSAQSGKRTLSGQVNDASGLPVPGAAVTIVGQSGGTVTDGSGKFSMSAPAGDLTVNVQCLGYVDKSQAVSAASGNIEITLDENTLSIEETVVVGYGVQKR